VSGPCKGSAYHPDDRAVAVSRAQGEFEKLGIKLRMLEIRSAGEVDPALAAAVKGGSRALVQLSSPLFDSPLAKRIADLR
jgi:hypothetical protein